MELLAVPLGLIPLAFASAIVRYRLMDVEVIVKRGLVYVAAASAVVAVYAILLRAVRLFFADQGTGHNTVIALLATLVLVLLARPMKDGIQNVLDRAFYRDRYDYRRALRGLRARPQHGPRSGAAERAPRGAHHRDAGHRPHVADAGGRGRGRVPLDPVRRVRGRAAGRSARPPASARA